jgi:hypothetical protein
MAIVLSSNAFFRTDGVVPALREALWEEAFRTKVVNSEGERSAIERR